MIFDDCKSYAEITLSVEDLNKVVANQGCPTTACKQKLSLIMT